MDVDLIPIFTVFIMVTILLQIDPSLQLFNAANLQAQNTRKQLEKFHGNPDPKAVATAWPYLKNSDRFIRYAARIAVEHQPVSEWQEKALSEKDPQAVIQAMIALARTGVLTLNHE